MAEEAGVKQKAKHVHAQAKNMMHSLHNSSYGKRIPLSMESVTLKTLLKVGLCAKIGYLFPAYLIVRFTVEPNGLLGTLVGWFKEAYVFIALLDVAVEALISMGKITSLFMVVPLAAVLKNMALILITLCYLMGRFTFTCFVMWLAFMVMTLGIDGMFVFYVSAQFNAIKEAEEAGEKEKEKEKTDMI